MYGTHSESYAWRGEGIFLRLIDDGSGSEANSCDMEPDVLLYPLPVTVGHAWQVDSACAGDGDAERYQASSEVVRAERITIGGREVDVFVIRTVLEMVGDGFTATSVELDSFAPSVGLSVRDEATYTVVEDGETTEWREEYELGTLDPQ